jgi:hypothetical protein
MARRVGHLWRLMSGTRPAAAIASSSVARLCHRRFGATNTNTIPGDWKVLSAGNDRYATNDGEKTSPPARCGATRPITG